MIDIKYKKILYAMTNNFFFRFISKKKMGNAIIFCYHRILPQHKIDKINLPDRGLVTSLENFEQQLKFFSEKYNCVSLDNLITNKKIDKKFKVCLTFDDGYKDNLDYALPLIEKYQIPTTIFITSRFLDDEVYLWWYELWDIINRKRKINFQWKKNKYLFYTETSTKKIFCYKKISNLFISENILNQNKLLEIISDTKKRKNYKNIFITKDNLSELSKNPLITIGNHSYNHLSFSKLNSRKIREEIELSIKFFNQYVDKIDHFAYPYGQLSDISEISRDLIKSYGFKSISTSINKNVFFENLNQFSLPRYGISNQDNLNSISVKISGFQSILSEKLNAIR